MAARGWPRATRGFEPTFTLPGPSPQPCELRRIFRVGPNPKMHVDVRIIAAQHLNQSPEGRFSTYLWGASKDFSRGHDIAPVQNPLSILNTMALLSRDPKNMASDSVSSHRPYMCHSQFLNASSAANVLLPPSTLPLGLQMVKTQLSYLHTLGPTVGTIYILRALGFSLGFQTFQPSSTSATSTTSGSLSVVSILASSPRVETQLLCAPTNEKPRMIETALEHMKLGTYTYIIYVYIYIYIYMYIYIHTNIQVHIPMYSCFWPTQYMHTTQCPEKT